MTREELREKAIEKLKGVKDGKDAIKAFMEVSSMYSFYLNDCVSPICSIELPFISSSMIMVGNAILESLDEDDNEVANSIMNFCVIRASRKAVDEK